MKTDLRMKLSTLNVYIKKSKKSQINNLMMNLKSLEKFRPFPKEGDIEK